MDDLTRFQRDLLYAIAGRQNPHGLAVKEDVQEYYETKIHNSRLYTNMDRLADRGLVEKGELDKRTNYYALTRRGERALEDRREWEDDHLQRLDEVTA